MKKLFFFIFPFALIFGLMMFVINGENDRVQSVNADDYGFYKYVSANIDYKIQWVVEDEKVENSPIIKKQEVNQAELLKFFPFGYIDNATFMLPEGISFI